MDLGGELGDAFKDGQIGAYETRNILRYNAGVYVFNGALAGGALADASFIPNLTWETSTQSNIGF